MKVFIYITFLICLLLFTSGASKTKTNISYKDLNDKYSIIGPLGIELGKVIELEVEKIQLNVKADPPTLKVISVNGKKLNIPVNLTYRMLIITDKFEYNKIYKVKAYQDGAFTGVPYEVMSDLLLQTTDHYFEVVLVVFKYI